MKRQVVSLITAAICYFTAPAQPIKATVYFDYDRFTLTTAATAALAAALKPGAPVDSFYITAHCDSIGSHAYNDWLAQKRLEAITAWLDSATGPNVVKTTTGFGKRLPLNDNSTAALRQLNRRAELAIYYPDTPAAAVVPTKPTPNPDLKEAVRQAVAGGNTIVLKNIEFVGGRHLFMPSATPALEELLRVMKDLPQLEIEIQGHICCQPGKGDGMDMDTYTMNLSVNRARAVYDYLRANGISTGRMRYTGFGHQFPVTQERTEAERTTNRRVEIKILKK